MSAEPLAGERIELRLLEPRHAELYAALHADAQVMADVGPQPSAATVQAAFLRCCRHNRQRHPGHRTWVVRTAADRVDAGIAALLRSGVEAEFGAMLFPHAWGQGIATDILRTVLAYAWNSLELEQVHAMHVRSPRNSASERLLASAGFARTTAIATGLSRWTIHRPSWRRPA